MRVAFFAHLPFHRPILASVHDAVGEQAERLLTSDRRQVVAFGPDVLVMAGHAGLEYFRRHLPRAFAVNVRHGMTGKGGISRLPERAAARTFDFVCVGNEESLPAYEEGGARPREYWRTGYPQIDPLFRRDPPPALPLGATRPTVLYAPTWNLGLTSATMLGARVVELIRAQAPQANIIIKPHPVIGDWRPRWMARWAGLAAREPGVLLVRDTHADIVPYMLAANLLISDASSAIFEFLALDRPIVLLTNPRHRADPAYAPGSIVWRWRDLGNEVHDVARLPGAVAEALLAPGQHAERRRHYARLLFGALTDGRNHVRVAERILGLEKPVARRARHPGGRAVVDLA
jgi:CDP-glycerol glycerophosphotransferase (TagB/SpsB family)